MIIDGREIAGEIIAELKAKPKPAKFFGAVLVGDDPASLNFLKQKEKVAKDLGVEFRLYRLAADMKTDELRREVGRLAGVKPCGGFIVQLPLHEGVNKNYVLNAIPKEKDADFLSEAALGAFYTGRAELVPPSVGVVEEILKRQNLDLRRLKVVVIGAGFLIGKPVGFWLQNRVAELTVIDVHAPHLRSELKEADVVISGAGEANLFSAADLKENAIVIDFGWNKKDGKISGDFNADSTTNNSSSLRLSEPNGLKPITFTPTPGGTGPILVAKLFENFYKLNA
ncbi:MAG: bifunctional 5,10-methylenetetrahydrofolate dehydrogenase/5,10-methenyltetrahydrofolate cyclohydrolase [Candidatus Brennerbacteria bacterium]|nr:bifunctional 5,10-methylenetetrahydrofolate dehydrogenase/5,10-methenyltetrahydrofolate cyclohydrolase [Candidatus Brennerbacteria bacterium]